jgi:protein SCO1/2
MRPAAPALPAVKAVTLLPDPRVLPAFSLQQSDGTR